MKLLIDYSTKLTGSFEKYRQNVAQLLFRDNELYKYSSKILPFSQNLVIKKTGFFSRNRMKSQEIDNFQALVTFGLQPKKVVKKIHTYIFIEPLIDEYLYRDDKRNIRKILSKLSEYKGILVRSEYLKLILVNQFNVEKDRIIVTWQGVNDNFFIKNIDNDERNVRRILTIYQITKPYIYISGDLDEYNAVDKFMEAFRNVHQKYPDVKLVIASPDFKIGWDNKPKPQNKAAAKILELVDDYKIFRKVVFAGKIDKKHLPIVISNAKIFADIHTKKYYSSALLEAIASRVPIIVGDAPVLKEIAQNACIAVSAKSIDSISTAIIDILADPEIESRLKVRTVTRIEYFSWTKSVNIILDRIKYDLRHKHKKKTLIIQREQNRLYPEEYLKKQFELEYYQLPQKIKLQDLWKLLNQIRQFDTLIFSNYINLSLFTFFKLILFKKSFYAIFPGFQLTEKSSKFKGLVQKIIFKIRIQLILFRLTKLFINNEFVYKKLRAGKYTNKTKFKYLPEIVDLNLKKIDKNILKESLNLKNYIPVTIRVGARDNQNLEILLDEITSIKNIKVLLITDNQLEQPNKKIIKLRKEKLYEALANSKLFIDISNSTSEEEILASMYLKNVGFFQKTNASRWLIHHGVNGFFMENLSQTKQIEIIKQLITNKDYLNDIRKVNYANSLQFSKESVSSSIDLVFN